MPWPLTQLKNYGELAIYKVHKFKEEASMAMALASGSSPVSPPAEWFCCFEATHVNKALFILSSTKLYEVGFYIWFTGSKLH